MALDLKKVENILKLAKRYKLHELELQEGSFRIQLKTSRAGHLAGRVNQGSQLSLDSLTPMSVPVPSSPGPVQHGAGGAVPGDSKVEERYHKVMSPFVGTFYRSPSPEADPYITEGQTVRKGDILCIVEAMKLMNEIECEVSGKVVACVAENGQPVEYGEPLFLVDPL